jgi:hypothetical protein
MFKYNNSTALKLEMYNLVEKANAGPNLPRVDRREPQVDFSFAKYIKSSLMVSTFFLFGSKDVVPPYTMAYVEYQGEGIEPPGD